jgi:hypothetical protein
MLPEAASEVVPEAAAGADVVDDEPPHAARSADRELVAARPAAAWVSAVLREMRGTSMSSGPLM